MKEYRDDIRARATAAGRNPDDIKLMFCISPTVLRRHRGRGPRRLGYRLVTTDSFVEKMLVGISSNTEIDFAQYDWDQPLPEGLTTNGERGSLEHFMRGDGSPGPKTLRQLAVHFATTGIDFLSARRTRSPAKWARRPRRSEATAS